MHELTFKSGMKELHDEYPERKEIECDRTMRRYWRMLRDLTDEEFDQAVEAAILNCRFFPKVSELRELAGAVRVTAGESRSGVREAYAKFFRGMGFDVPDSGTVVINARAVRRGAPDGNAAREPVPLPVAS